MTTRHTTAHHRPVRRVDDALDYAFDAGQYAYANELLEAQLDEARRKLAPPPRGKRLWSWFWTILLFGGSLFLFFWIGQVSAVRPMPDGQPLGTAQIAPTRPPNQEPTVGDYGVGAYNATQEARQDSPAATAAPTWIGDGGSVITPPAPDNTPTPGATPLPAPGQPGFVQSFKPAGCAIGITYLDHNDPCYSVPPGAKLPEPGEDGFVESFK